MGDYLITLTAEEARQWQAFLTWHAAQPTGSLQRRWAMDQQIDTIEEFLDVLIAPAKVMIQQWWEQHPDVHRGASDATP